jgi:hypothetical protein
MHDSIELAETHQPEGAELARYDSDDGVRILVAHTVGGRVQVTDCPTYPDGPVYDVDSGFESFEQLAAFVADYCAQAERLRACPMSRRAISRALDLDPGRPREAVS